jgi:hypothetical protein
MTAKIDPLTGNLVPMSHGAPIIHAPGCYPAIQLTPEQREKAQYADEFAQDVLALMDSGKRWFTAFEIKQKPDSSLMLDLEQVGVITKHKSGKHDGHYYKLCPVARSFCLTALALRDERGKKLRATQPQQPG